MTRSKVLALLAVVPLGLAACGPPPPPPPPAPPSVDLTFVESNVAGLSTKVRVSVVGCASVASVTLTDRDQPIAIPAFAANPLEVELTRANVSFREGIGARLLLKARATCADGTAGESIPVGGSFFPVAQVSSPSTTGTAAAAAPDVFYVEEPGGAARNFFGCMRMTNGTRAIAKTDAAGALLGTVANPPFACRAGGPGVQFTGRVGPSWHWFFDPDQGAFPFSSALGSTPAIPGTIRANVGYPAFAGGLADAALSLRGDGSYLQLWRPGGARLDPVWDQDGSTAFAGVFASFQRWLGPARAVGGASRTYFIPAFFTVRGADENVTAVWRLQESTTTPAVPTVSEFVHFRTTPQARAAAFNARATRVYYAQAPTADSTRIVSCDAAATGCTGRRESAVLPAAITTVAAYGGDTRLLALAQRQAWILDATTLAVLTPGGGPLLTTGPLEWKYVDFGPGEQLFLMSGPVASPLPTEVAAYESASSGELYRFESPADTVFLALDSTGQAWMRHGSQLLKLLTWTEYKQLRAR